MHSKSSTSWKNDDANSEIEVPKERSISPEKRQKMDYDWYNDITMEYQKIINLLENGVALNASNQLSKFRTKNVLKLIMNQKEHTLLIDKLLLKHQC